jgi:hypothetical protein
MRLAVDNPDAPDPLLEQFENSTVHQLPLAVEPFTWPDPASLAPRPWLLGVQALAGYVTAIVSPGGVGKTALSIGMALSVAANRPLLEHRVWVPGPVWIWNLEDGRDELVRRVAAAAKHYRLDRATCAPIYINSGRDRPLCVARLAPNADGVTSVTHPDEEALTREAKARGVRMIVVDPFVSSHDLDENSNGHMAAAMAAWARIAAAVNCAVILVHHTRKGATGGNIEDARGGSAIAAAARVGLTLARMDDDAGERFNIAQAERWRYVRVDDAKANLAPRADKAAWFRLASVELGNATATYPSGDSIQVAEPWTPPDVFEDVTPEQTNRALDIIDAGPKPGWLYTLNRMGRGGGDRWAGTVLMDVMDINDTQAKHIMAAWAKSGLILETTFRDVEEGKARKGVRVDAAKRPTQ